MTDFAAPTPTADSLPAMSRQRRFIMRMTIFVVLVLGVTLLLAPTLAEAFLANPVLNGLIGGVLLAGIIYTFRQVLMLGPEVVWIENFRRGQDGLGLAQEMPILLAPMAVMLGERHGKVMLSAVSTRSILDSVFTRLDESRDISRYTIGLLIFLGLLGTFWGLLSTVGSIGATIQSLSVDSGNSGAVFDELKAGLEAPLAGMGTAFSSSLFGLGGSLVLGFLDLSASQAQNRFYNELEEWLSGQTRLSSGSAGLGDGDASAPAYVTALLEQTADSVERLQGVISRNEDSRAAGNHALLALSEQLAALTDRMQGEQDAVRRLIDGQRELRPVLEKLSEERSRDESGLDSASRQHLRNIDVHLLRLMEDAAEGRERSVNEVRSEIKLLTRTVAAMADERREG